MELIMNQMTRKALEGIEGRALTIWYNEISELLEEHDLFMGRIEFINFLHNEVDLPFAKIFPIFDFMMEYYEGLFEEQIIYMEGDLL